MTVWKLDHDAVTTLAGSTGKRVSELRTAGKALDTVGDGLADALSGAAGVLGAAQAFLTARQGAPEAVAAHADDVTSTTKKAAATFAETDQNVATVARDATTASTLPAHLPRGPF